jgi:DNA-binding transcriptional ArsR family regulator
MRNAETDRVYRAIADPTRRAILDILTDAECSVKELTSRFSVSQPAISQHLGELRAANLVAARRVHRENRYRVTAGPLQPVITWMDGFRRLMDPAGHLWAIGPIQKKEGS